MLQAYTDTVQTLTTGQAVKFNSTVINNTPCAISFTEGNTSIKLKRQGYYLLQFNATGVATAAQNTGIQMYVNGVAVSYAQAESTPAAIGDDFNLAFSTIVPVKCSCCAIDNVLNIDFRATSDTSTSIANIIITKIA